MNRKLIFVAALAAVAYTNVVMAASSKSQPEPRDKRSYSWLPSFLGGGSSASNDADAVLSDDDAAAIVENRIESYNPQSVGSFPDASAIVPNIANGRVINNQFQYPVWRVHKYHGLNLQPLPISLVQGASGYQTVDGQTVNQEIEPVPVVDQEVDAQFSPESQPQFPPQFPPQFASQFPSQQLPQQLPQQPPASSSSDTWLSPELIQMARLFGVTDFSNLPSLQEAMDVLGTTTREETIEAIKEFAATESGRTLIRQFVEGGSSQDNEVSGSENQEVTANAEDIQNALASGQFQGAGPNLNQFLFQPINGDLFSQFATFGSGQPQSEAQSADEDPTTFETSTPSSFFSRITQWANFLNPLGNREEIPIPPIEGEVIDDGQESLSVNDENISNQQSIPIPELPELPSLPNIPGIENLPLRLPIIRISNQYASPINPYANHAFVNSNGQFVRVQLPFGGYPTPQYLYDGRNQLQQVQQQQGIVQTPYVPVDLPNAGDGTPIHISQPEFANQPIETDQPIQDPLLPRSEAVNFAQPQPTPSFAGQPIHVPNPVNQLPNGIQQIQNLQLPLAEPKPFRVAATAPINRATHVGQLPLVSNANYEIFRNAPRIRSSYGQPAPPFTYDHHEYDLKPSASEIVEQKINANGDVQTVNANSIIEGPSNTEKVEENEKKVVKEEIANSTINAKITPDANHNNTSEQPKLVSQPKTIDNEKPESVETEVKAAVQKPSNNRSIYNKLRPTLKEIAKNSNEKNIAKGPITSHIQRISSHENYGTGKMYRADPKAVEMLPFTVRHKAKKTQTDDDNQE